MSAGMCFAAALMTHLLIPCHGIPVQSPVSPSLSLFLLLVVETTVEMFSGGVGLAVPGGSRVAWLSFREGAVPWVHPTVVVIPLPFPILCFTSEIIIYKST